MNEIVAELLSAQGGTIGESAHELFPDGA